MMQTHPETTFAEGAAELLWVQAQRRGIPPSEELAAMCWKKALEAEERDRRASQARGVSKDLRELLGAGRK
jgi:hypothetical protein